MGFDVCSKAEVRKTRAAGHQFPRAFNYDKNERTH
jgi:hypothetical protein